MGEYLEGVDLLFMWPRRTSKDELPEVIGKQHTLVRFTLPLLLTSRKVYFVVFLIILLSKIASILLWITCMLLEIA
jgi:hypothetical protein